ncbi:hypothetical protein J3P77_18960 [Pseudomonas sp. R1-18]|uniref:hypothetical protein n=1 Tax=Pseudomonas sp. R1-18 TaxID=1632772 RepID=UPI003DAA3C74
MSLIAKWALQLVAVFLFAWAATVAAQWSSGIVNGTGTERLAQLTQAQMTAVPGNSRLATVNAAAPAAALDHAE